MKKTMLVLVGLCMVLATAYSAFSVDESGVWVVQDSDYCYNGVCEGDLNVSHHNLTNIDYVLSAYYMGSSLLNCDTIDTDANGFFVCGTDQVGAGGDGNLSGGGTVNYIPKFYTTNLLHDSIMYELNDEICIAGLCLNETIDLRENDTNTWNSTGDIANALVSIIHVGDNSTCNLFTNGTYFWLDESCRNNSMQFEFDLYNNTIIAYIDEANSSVSQNCANISGNETIEGSYYVNGTWNFETGNEEDTGRSTNFSNVRIGFARINASYLYGEHELKDTAQLLVGTGAEIAIAGSFWPVGSGVIPLGLFTNKFSVLYTEQAQVHYLNCSGNALVTGEGNVSRDLYVGEDLIVDKTANISKSVEVGTNINITRDGGVLEIPYDSSAGDYFRFGKGGAIILPYVAGVEMPIFGTEIAPTTGLSFDYATSQVTFQRADDASVTIDLSGSKNGDIITVGNITISTQGYGIKVADVDGVGSTCCVYNNGNQYCRVC